MNVLRLGAQLEVGDLLPRPRELRLVLAAARLELGDAPLQAEEPRLRHVALREQRLVRRLLLALQLDRRGVGCELFLACADLALGFPDLGAEERDLVVERLAARAEERRLALQHLGHARIARARLELAWKRDLRRPALLGGEAGALGELHVELRLDELVAGVDADVLEHDQRLACLHLRPIANQDFPDDAALLVLHGLAVHVDLHHAGGDRRAAERGEGRPARQREHEQAEAGEAGAGERTGIRDAVEI